MAVAEGRELADVQGISFRRDGDATSTTTSRPPLDHRAARRAAVRHRDLRARPRLQEVQQPLLPVSVRVALHRPRLPGALHLLPLAAGDDRSQLPHAQRRATSSRSARTMKRLFPEMKELFFDDDTFTADPQARASRSREGSASSASPGRPTRAPTSTARRSTIAEGRRAAPVRGRLRVGQRADPEEHQEGRRASSARAASPSDCHDLGILIHGTFILGLPGRDARDASRRRSASRRRCGRETLQVSLASPYPGHGDLRLGARATTT